MSKELLKSMLQDIINDKHDDASSKLHDYMVVKNREVIGIAEASDDDDDEEEQGMEVRVTKNNGDDIRSHEISGLLDGGDVDYDHLNIKGDRAYFTVFGDEGAPLEQLFDEDEWDIEYL